MKVRLIYRDGKELVLDPGPTSPRFCVPIAPLPCGLFPCVTFERVAESEYREIRRELETCPAHGTEPAISWGSDDAPPPHTDHAPDTSLG